MDVAGSINAQDAGSHQGRSSSQCLRSNVQCEYVNESEPCVACTRLDPDTRGSCEKVLPPAAEARRKSLEAEARRPGT